MGAHVGTLPVGAKLPIAFGGISVSIAASAMRPSTLVLDPSGNG